MWSSVTSVRARSRRAASSRRNYRSICPILQSPTPRRVSRRVSGSRPPATAARSVSPSVREQRSMADQEEKKAKKPAKAKDEAKTAKAPKAAKAEGKKADSKKADGGKPEGEKGKKAAKGAKAEAPAPVDIAVPPPRLKTIFDTVIRKKLTEQFGYRNAMQVPVVDKVVINMGVGEAVADRKKVESAANDLALIAGQKPVITKSRKAISTYKLRENQPIGCKVTLRKTRMFEFIDRLINIALPRVRDFRGLNPKSFD